MQDQLDCVKLNMVPKNIKGLSILKLEPSVKIQIKIFLKYICTVVQQPEGTQNKALTFQ